MNIKQFLPYGLIIAFFAGAVYIISGFELDRRLDTIEEIRCLVVNPNNEPTGQVRHLEKRIYRAYLTWHGKDVLSIGKKSRGQNGN